MNPYRGINPIGSSSASVTAASLAAHEAAADPHPQYLTAAEADALFLTPAEGDVLFLTPAEGNAAYSPLVHTHDDRYYTEAEADALFLTNAEGDALFLTPAEGNAAYEVIGAVAAHAVAADPHVGYQKESEKGALNGYASLDAAGTVPDAQIPAAIARDAEVTASIVAHEAAANPHPIYLTQAEADALYSVLAHIHDHGTLTGLGDNDHPQYLLAAVYTAADVLAKLLTVDGAGSGLDADLLDTFSEAAFLRFRGEIAVADIDAARTTGYYRVTNAGDSHLLLDIGGVGGSTPRIQLLATYGDDLYFRAARDLETEWDGFTSQSKRLWHSGNDGAGSTLDADLLDGLQAAAFALAAHTHLLASGATDVTMTVANLNSLDDGADSSLHFHASDRARANHTGTQLSATLSDFAESVDDRVAALLLAGTGITLTYDDVGGTLTVAASATASDLDNIIDASTSVVSANKSRVYANALTITATGELKIPITSSVVIVG